MVRKGMMRIGHADFRIGSVAGFARELKSNHAGDVALQSQNLQIEHQAGVVCIGGGHSDGRSKSGSGLSTASDSAF